MSSSREWPQRERATRRRERWGAVVSGRSAVVSGVCAVVSVRRVVVSVTRRGMTAGGEAASVDSDSISISISISGEAASVDLGGGGRRVRAYPQISVASGGRARVRSDAPWSTRPSFVVSLACKCPPRRPMAHTSTRPQRAPAAMAPTHQTTRQRQGGSGCER